MVANLCHNYNKQMIKTTPNPPWCCSWQSTRFNNWIHNQNRCENDHKSNASRNIVYRVLEHQNTNIPSLQKHWTKTTKKTVSKKTTNKKEKCEPCLFEESIELSEAVIKEIDNVMSSSLPSAQVGKILGDIISSFSTQIEELKSRKTWHLSKFHI